MIQIFLLFSDWALLILRVILGLIYLAHGWPKIKDLKTTAQNFGAMGFKPGQFWGTLIAVLEFFGGLALIFGFLVQPVAALLAIEMVVATIWKIRKGQKLVGGYEFDLVLIGALLVLGTIGSQLYALDSFLNLRLF